MAWMASVRTASARAMIASSSLSSPVTICRLKVLISANSACICSAISWVSCLEFAIEASSAWMSFLVVRTFSSSSANSFFRRSSRFMLADTSALISRVAFFWLRALHFLSNVSFQRDLRTTCFYSLLCSIHFYPEEWKIASWPKLDLQRLRELGFYLLEDVLYFAGITN